MGETHFKLENLEKILLYFEATIFQDIEYFDDPGNTPGVICSRLNSDCSRIAGVTGIRMATLLQRVIKSI